MKSVLIWLLSVAIGSLVGYGLRFIVEINVFLLITVGALVGSSFGITWNIHREREAPHVELISEGESEAAKPAKKKKSNQKAS